MNQMCGVNFVNLCTIKVGPFYSEPQGLLPGNVMEIFFRLLDPGVQYTATPNNVEQGPAVKSCYESRVILQLLLFFPVTVEILSSLQDYPAL